MNKNKVASQMPQIRLHIPQDVPSSSKKGEPVAPRLHFFSCHLYVKVSSIDF